MKLTISFLVLLIANFIHAQSPKVHPLIIGKKEAAKSFSFIHITDTHIGEGEADRDYGTVGYFDTLDGKEWGYPAARLSSSVQWINANAKAAGVDFVLVSGDLTDSGEKSEFMHFKKLMDSLSVPYFPLMGNHDAWSYNRFGDEAATATGDSLMNEVFAGTFAGLDSSFTLRNSSRNNSWWNEESKTFVYLQNFHYSHKGYSFIFLDFNPRYHVRKDEPGIGPEAQLMLGAGGTFEFLKTALATAKELNERVFLISHHPPIASLFGFHFAFTAKEKTQLAREIKPYKKLIDGWFAGHIHRYANYNFTKAKMLSVFETKANKAQRFGGFRLVRVKQ